MATGPVAARPGQPRMNRGRVLLSMASSALLVASCSMSRFPPQTPVPTPAFDVGAVSQNFVDLCNDNPMRVGTDVCTYVALSAMSGDFTGRLEVPTTLPADPEETDSRAAAICNAIAREHFDVDGEDLRYKSIEVDDREGGTAASCPVN